MKNLTTIIGFFAIIFFFQSCIKDDFIDDLTDAELRITTSIDTLAFEGEFQLEARFLNTIGQQENVPIEWESSNQEIITVDASGKLFGVSVGNAIITASTVYEDEIVRDSIFIAVAGNVNVQSVQSIFGVIETTTFYTLEGDFQFIETPTGVTLKIDDNYEASSSLPGLYVYLSNNRNSISGAHEISEVTTFSGSHEYDIDGVGFNDYNYIVYFCKPFNVKVGDAELNF